MTKLSLFCLTILNENNNDKDTLSLEASLWK